MNELDVILPKTIQYQLTDSAAHTLHAQSTTTTLQCNVNVGQYPFHVAIVRVAVSNALASQSEAALLSFNFLFEPIIICVSSNVGARKYE